MVNMLSCWNNQIAGIIYSLQTESKLGYIFLQSCDGCASHAIIKQVARKLLMEAAEVLAAAQAPPRLPPSPQDYVGDYTNRVGHSQVWGISVGHSQV